jgi:hypothetical protein
MALRGVHSATPNNAATCGGVNMSGTMFAVTASMS